MTSSASSITCFGITTPIQLTCKSKIGMESVAKHVVTTSIKTMPLPAVNAKQNCVGIAAHAATPAQIGFAVSASRPAKAVATMFVDTA